MSVNNGNDIYNDFCDKEIRVGTGEKYNTLRSAFNAAFEMGNTRIIINPGVYDLVSECSDILNGDPLDQLFTPCPIGKGVHAIFLDGAHVLSNVEKGDFSTNSFNTYKQRFEPFSYKEGGDFTLENLDIKSKNCRYCVHDDKASTVSIHKFLNCKMYHETSNTTNFGNYVNCIGGGMGAHSTILIIGGYYESNVINSLDNTIENGDPNYNQIPIFYHNGSSSICEGSISLFNVYFANKGYFLAEDYGTSTKLTNIYICGCRFGLPFMQRKAALGVDVVNMNYKSTWNNEIAQNGTWTIDSDGRTASFTPS